MKLGDLLPLERIVVPLPGKTLRDAAEQLIGAFVDTGLADDAGYLVERVGDIPPREAVTVGDEAFILHFRTDAVTGTGAALGVTDEPVVLEPESDRTARVVVVLVAPHRESSTFLQAISVLDRVLSAEDVMAGILAAGTSGDVAAVPGLLDPELPGQLRVSDVMLRRPRSVWPDASLGDAAKVMLANRLPAIPVTSAQGEVLGLVSHRIILEAVLPHYLRTLSAGSGESGADDEADGQDPREIPVREVMDRSVLCVSEDQTLADVATILVGKPVDRFPVVRDGVLVGLLTRQDIVRRLFGP